MTRASSPVPTDLRSAALAYSKRGWPVFPLWEAEKTPITKNGFKSATTNRDVILNWWTLWPDANIGLATGIAFDVLDIDGEEGRASLFQFLEEQGASGYVHTGPVSFTGKGWHLLFAPTGCGNRANMLPKLDFRGTGGYIVAPPSLHPLGHHYRWDQTRNDRAALPTAPPWLTTLLERNNEDRPAAKTRVLINEHASPGTSSEILLRNGHLALSRPDIIAVASQLGLYMQSSRSHTHARCPFHHGLSKAQEHAGTPSMQLDTEKNNFYCHACHAYGDSLDLQARRDIQGKTF